MNSNDWKFAAGEFPMIGKWRIVIRENFMRGLKIIFALAASASFAAEKPLSFNRDIRPILSDRCFACHGPDSNKRQADLRFDRQEGFSAPLPRHTNLFAFVAGKPEASEACKRIFSADEKLVMPPPKSNLKLTDAEKNLIKTWIAQGAKWQPHWAFIKPERVPPPEVRDAKWPRNEIDKFILARLEAEGLKPSQEADRPALIRRVSLDLTGIPPTPAEVAAFVSDTSADAYEKIVDRLLASPRYGEAMAARWLDFARYADSNGFQTDSERYMWPWRDWVINAFNTNMPFNEFTIEQIAGDLMTNATMSQKVASGFNRNHRINEEGGAIPAEWRVEYVMDRVEATSETWLGLTMQCARCHDHKFDPISQKEFYSFFAFFNNLNENGLGGAGNNGPILSVQDPATTAKIAELDKQIADAKTAQTAAEKNIGESQVKWEKIALASSEKAIEWHVLDAQSISSANGATLTKEADGAIFSGGTTPDTDTYTFTTASDLSEITAIKLELIPDDRLPSHGPGRHPNGNPVLSELTISAGPKSGAATNDVAIRDQQADFNQDGYDVAKSDDGDKGTGWAIYPNVGKHHEAVFAFREPVKFAGGAKLAVTMDQNYGSGSLIGKFRISATTAAMPIATPMEIREILKTAAGRRKEDQKKKLADYFATQEPELAAAVARVAALTKQKAALAKPMETVMVMEEMAKPRDTFVLLRGQYDKPGAQVSMAVPAILPALPSGAPTNRLGLALWLVDPSHPLTARVAVNRYWEKFFGNGIVKTIENIGSQSEWPSHPELLDWLATEFVRLKWDMKAIQKEMVMSATYRQSSKLTADLIERDPENRLLARGPRFRLPAETIRDQALAISGLLVEKVGGPSVRPYMPQGVWDETSVYGNLRNYQAAKDDGLYRRTMYTIWKRTAAPPSLMLFDAPSRELCTIRRSRTDTPLQALALLNEVTYVEAARKLAEHMMTDGGATSQDRIRFAFERATARQPSESESKILGSSFQRSLERFQKDKPAAEQLLAMGESKHDNKLDAAELGAYTMTARVILNLDEVVTKE